MSPDFLRVLRVFLSSACLTSSSLPPSRVTFFFRVFSMQNWLYCCLRSKMCALNLGQVHSLDVSEPVKMTETAAVLIPGCVWRCEVTLWNQRRRPGVYALAHMAMTSSNTQKTKTRDLHPGEMLFSNILTLEPNFKNVQFQALKTQAPLTRKVETIDYVTVYSDTHLCVNGVSVPRNEFKQAGSLSFGFFQWQQPHGLLAAAAAVPDVTSSLHTPLPPSQEKYFRNHMKQS